MLTHTLAPIYINLHMQVTPADIDTLLHLPTDKHASELGEQCR